MTEIIEKLKKNLCVRCRLSKEEREVMDAVPDADMLMLDPDGEWVIPAHRTLNYNRYRIAEDYSPEPETPHFPGYVLCKVEIKEETGLIRYHDPSVGWACLSIATDYGCVGYVPIEKIGGMWRIFTYWPVWVNGKGDWINWVDEDYIEDGYKPATLGWVVFKENQE